MEFNTNTGGMLSFLVFGKFAANGAAVMCYWYTVVRIEVVVVVFGEIGLSLEKMFSSCLVDDLPLELVFVEDERFAKLK